MITSGYALVGRTFKPRYFKNWHSALEALREMSEAEVIVDGRVAIWRMVGGVWHFVYEPDEWIWR